MRVPSGLNAAVVTLLSWPRRTAISFAVAASHTRAVLSEDAVTMRVPSRLNAAEARTSRKARRQSKLKTVAASAAIEVDAAPDFKPRSRSSSVPLAANRRAASGLQLFD